MQVGFSGEVDGGYASTASHPSGRSAPHCRPRSVGCAWGDEVAGRYQGCARTRLGSPPFATDPGKNVYDGDARGTR